MEQGHQEPDLTDKSDIDPSIDPKVLVGQNGDDAGQISAAETSVGETAVDPPESHPGLGTDERPGEIIEGLPVIGAEAENEIRDTFAEGGILHGFHPGRLNDAPSWARRDSDMGKDNDKAVEAKAIEALADADGTEAMAKEVRSRAEGIAKARAVAEAGKPPSDEKVKEYADLIEASFRSELEKKSQESIKAANAIVDTMIVEAKAKVAEGKPVSEVVPGTVEPTEATSVENPADLFKSISDTPKPESKDGVDWVKHEDAGRHISG